MADIRSALRALAMAVAVAAVAACGSQRTRYVKTYSAAFAAPPSAPAKLYVATAPASHAGQSGFRLLVDNNDALMSRVVLADRATSAIDLQYYIFDDDTTGRLIAQRLLAAADRGVRVRLLLDDLDTGDAERLLEGLDAHANIEVRVFNPYSTRNPSLISKVGQFLVDGPRLNRRMHNKSFVVDNTVAILGGRNIGDAYFEAGDTQHFRDLDVIAIGPVVAQTSRAFDAYWNDKAAVPIAAFESAQASADDVATLRGHLARTARALTASDYAASLKDALPGGRDVDRAGQWLWGRAAVVADEPQKVDDGGDDASLLQPRLDALIGSAQREVLLISAYFVPGDDDTRHLVELARRGIAVKVLTNSLAATDEPLVHAGYARARRALLAGGVQLFEMRPLQTDRPPAHGISSGVSLHAKAIVVERAVAFVGSMNLDQRSKLLNTEMGVVADSPELAAACAGYFDSATRPANAFEVELDHAGDRAGADRGTSVWNTSLVWRATDAAGNRIEWHHEPEASLARRLQVDMLRLLPIDGLL